MLIGAVASAAWLLGAQWARIGVGRPSHAARRTDAPRPRPALSIPPGLDRQQVLDAARARFMRLQAAWDAADVATLRSLTTPDMLQELMHILATRGSVPSRTDVVSLHAELLGLEELNVAYLASVEFSGLISESAERGPLPFRELWMLACMKDGPPAWRLARQQSLL